MNCDTIEPGSRQDKWLIGLESVEEKWNSMPTLVKLFGEYGSSNDATTMLHETFYHLTGNMMGFTPPERFNQIHFHAVIREIDRLEQRAANPRHNGVVDIVGTAAANLEASPQTRQFKREIQQVANFESTNMNRIQTLINGRGVGINKMTGIRQHIVQAMIDDANIEGFRKKGKANKIIDDIQTIEARIVADMANYARGDKTASARIEQNKQLLKDLLDSKGGRVNKQLIAMLDQYSKRDIEKFKAKGSIKIMVDGVETHIENGNLFEAAIKSKEMMEEVGKNLVYGLNGLEGFIKTVYENGAYEDVLTSKIVNDRQAPSQLKSRLTMVRKVIDHLNTSIEEGRYYPHMLLEINADIISRIPSIMESARDTEGKWTENTKEIEQFFQRLENFIPDVAKARNSRPEPGYSENALGVMKQYAMDVIQFNKIVHSQNALVKALRRMPKGPEAGRGYEGLRQYVNDSFNLHMEGYQARGGTINNMVRWITGLEFVSKMGFNAFKTALKNYTSKVFWINHMGYKKWYQAKYKRKYEYRNLLDEMGKTYAGFYFGADAASVSQGGYNETENLRATVVEKEGKFKPRTDSFKDKVDQGSKKALGYTISKAGVLQQMAENNVRRDMFESTFVHIYEKMMNQKAHFTMIEMQRGKHDDEQSAWNAAHEKIKKDAASFALNAVNEWAFDYAPTGKAKLMGGTRSRMGAVGQVIFQYMHYLNDFTFRQGSQSAKGVHAIKDAMSAYKKHHKDGLEFSDTLQYIWDNPDSRGAIYTMAMEMVVGYISLAFAHPVSNLVSNATLDTARKLWEFMTTDDEEELKKINFGGGVASLLTGPVIADIITVGTAMQMFDMPDNDQFQFWVSYNNHYNKPEDEREQEIQRTLSPHLYNLKTRDMPNLANGNFGAVIIRNTGLTPYKTFKEESDAFRNDNAGVRRSLDYLRSQQQLPQRRQQRQQRDPMNPVEINPMY